MVKLDDITRLRELFDEENVPMIGRVAMCGDCAEQFIEEWSSERRKQVMAGFDTFYSFRVCPHLSRPLAVELRLREVEKRHNREAANG